MKIINLSKFIGYTVTALILCLCMFWSPSFASASTSSTLNNVKSENEVNSSSTTSRYVTVDGYYYAGPLEKANIPTTIYYNENGYTGTLVLTSAEFLVEWYKQTWKITYGGWATCTGVCHAPASIEEF